MQKSIYKIDMTKIEGEGDFPCPKCGTTISPDDETENVYTIIDIVENDDSIDDMSIRCNKCNSKINISGFDQLSTCEEGNVRIEVSESLPESKPNYITYHTVSLDGKNIGNLTVEFAQEADVQAFKRLRKLRAGDPFKRTVTLTMDNVHLENEDLQEIAKAVKRKFKGLRDNDTYILENKGGQKNLLGRF